MERGQIRQGDVLLVPVYRPRKFDRALQDDGQPLAGVRVEGERTGHAHVLPGRVYDGVGGRRLIFLERPTTITHEEHRHVAVPAGWWEVRVQREVQHHERQVTGRWD
jgi:hypothetical protein